MRFFPSCLLGVISVATAALVPGKAFDRFITIWLENQVKISPSPTLTLMRDSMEI